jgi:di/tricarboxylate transporter
MTPDSLITAIVIVIMSAMLITDLSRPSFVLFGSLLILKLSGVLSLEQTFAGFANHGMLTVGVLFVVAGSLQSSHAFVSVVEWTLGHGTGVMRYFRLMVPVTFFSAFLNNTPVVASLIPIVRKWARKHDIAASKYLIPLSYASILGGMCTLIGTSTNLVIHGMLLDHGMEGFSFFELTSVGLPAALVGILYFALLGHRLLPERKDFVSRVQEHSREFVVEMKVTREFPYLGKTLEEANLRHLKGLYLFQILRGDKEIAPVSHSERVYENDRLFFTGLPETIYELQKYPGLSVIRDGGIDFRNIDSDKLKTFEAVVSNTSPLVGHTVRDSNFRSKYGAVILGIHRGGKRINKKVGDIVLQPNDTLFILARRNFGARWYHAPDFSLVSKSVDEYSRSRTKGIVAVLLLFGMVFSVASGLVESMLIAASVAACGMIVTRIVTFQEAKQFVDFDVLLSIVSALGIGKAVYVSGLADIISHSILTVMSGFGVVGILCALFVLTSLYTHLITNNAAAAIMFPIALSMANTFGVDPRAMIIVITLAASACFATPLGYQTNLMVYHPGGYRFVDFVKNGMVVNVLVGIVVVACMYWFYFG